MDHPRTTDQALSVEDGADFLQTRYGRDAPKVAIGNALLAAILYKDEQVAYWANVARTITAEKSEQSQLH